MAGLSPNELQNIIGRAKKLCNPTGDKLVNANIDQSDFKKQLDESYDVPSVDDYDDAEQWDSLYSDNASEAYNNSRMPEHIKKSMLEHKIDTNALQDESGDLDFLTEGRERTTLASKRKNAVNENIVSRQPAAGAIDYSLIKAIVSECIRETLANQSLNEGTLSQIHLKKGVLSLVDSSGNVYRAKLEKIGNANDKK